MRLKLRALRLEVHQGHDGWLRGLPEPAVVICVYGEAGGRSRVLAKQVLRFTLQGALPGTAALVGDGLLPMIAVRREASLTILAAGVEHDSGRGLGAVSATLEAPERLQLLTPAQQLVELGDPLELAAHLPAGVVAAPVTLFVDGQDLARTCQGDDWVGVAALRVQNVQASQRGLRLHLDGGRNQWTLVADLLQQR